MSKFVDVTVTQGGESATLVDGFVYDILHDIFSNVDGDIWIVEDPSFVYQDSDLNSPASIGDPIGGIVGFVNSISILQSNAANRLQYVNQGDYPAVEASANSQTLTKTESLSAPFSVGCVVDTTGLTANDPAVYSDDTNAQFILYLSTSFGSANNQIRIWTSSGEVIVGPDIRDTGTRSVMYVNDGTNSKLFVDGIEVVSNTNSSGSPSRTFHHFNVTARPNTNTPVKALFVTKQALIATQVSAIHNRLVP